MWLVSAGNGNTRTDSEFKHGKLFGKQRISKNLNCVNKNGNRLTERDITEQDSISFYLDGKANTALRLNWKEYAWNIISQNQLKP